MNIFYLDSDHVLNASYHNNKHCVKMLVEYTQLLSTAVRESGIDAGYKTTHKNHPSAIWARESLDNWLWLRDLVVALNNEFVYRYEKTVTHKSYDMAMTLPKPNIPSLGFTKFRLAMPDDVKQDDPILAYRDYYRKYKRELSNWKKRDIPEWYK
jgi:hypothetical protein